MGNEIAPLSLSLFEGGKDSLSPLPHAKLQTISPPFILYSNSSYLNAFLITMLASKDGEGRRRADKNLSTASAIINV